MAERRVGCRAHDRRLMCCAFVLIAELRMVTSRYAMESCSIVLDRRLYIGDELHDSCPWMICSSP